MSDLFREAGTSKRDDWNGPNYVKAWTGEQLGRLVKERIDGDDAKIERGF